MLLQPHYRTEDHISPVLRDSCGGRLVQEASALYEMETLDMAGVGRVGV